MIEHLRRKIGVVLGVVWFLVCTIGGAIIIELVLRRHTSWVAPVLPLLIVVWVGIFFLVRWLLSYLPGFVFPVKSLDVLTFGDIAVTVYTRATAEARLAINSVCLVPSGEATVNNVPSRIHGFGRRISYSQGSWAIGDLERVLKPWPSRPSSATVNSFAETQSISIDL